MVSANDSVTLQRLLSSLVFVQKFKFILMKMHKNCCHQSYSFWLRYAPNRLSAGASPQTPLGSSQRSSRPPSWFRGWTPRGKERREGMGKGKRGGRRGEGRGREGTESRNAQIQSWQAYQVMPQLHEPSLPAGRFQSGCTCRIHAARARWWSSRGELRAIWPKSRRRLLLLLLLLKM